MSHALTNATSVAINSTQFLLESTVTASPWEKFYRDYRSIHGYISCTVCIFGLLSNVVNMIVLTRKSIINPVNCILTALASVDFMIISTYLVYAVYFYIGREHTWQANHSKAWMYFVLIHNHFIIVFHNMSLWFTVYLAMIRNKVICRKTFSHGQHNMKQTLTALFVIAGIILGLCLPNFFLYKVVALSEILGPNVPGYWIVDSNFVAENYIFKTVIFWFFGVLMRVTPCVLLTNFTCLIILTMYRSKKQRDRLQEHVQQQGRHRDHVRTTWMLLAVVFISVLTEFPQGILALISALNDEFFINIYSNIGDFLDLLVLINSSVNLVLYCSMSRQYRNTLVQLLPYLNRRREIQ